MSAPAPPDDPHYRLLGDDDVLQPGDQETLPNRRPAGARLAWAWRETVMTGRRVGEVREWASHYRRPLPETAYRALDGDEVEADLEVLPSDIIVYTVNTRLDGQEQMVQVEFIGDYQRVMEVPPCGLSHKQWEQVRQQAAAARPGAVVAAFGQFYKVV